MIRWTGKTYSDWFDDNWCFDWLGALGNLPAFGRYTYQSKFPSVVDRRYLTRLAQRRHRIRGILQCTLTTSWREIPEPWLQSGDRASVFVIRKLMTSLRKNNENAAVHRNCVFASRTANVMGQTVSEIRNRYCCHVIANLRRNNCDHVLTKKICYQRHGSRFWYVSRLPQEVAVKWCGVQSVFSLTTLAGNHKIGWPFH